MATQRELFEKHKWFMNHYMKLLTQFSAVEEAPLPKQPLIFAANHPTTTDPFLLPLLVDDPIHILVIETAFKVPVLGKLIEAAGHHRVYREQGSGGKLVDQAVESLHNGNHVGIFPEGRLSAADGTFMPAHSGAARIAMLSGALVVPVGIHISPNAYVVKYLKDFPNEPPLRWITRGSYFLTIGRPMQISGDDNDYSVVQANTQKITNAIQMLAEKSRRRMQLYPSNWGMIFRMLQRVEAIFS